MRESRPNWPQCTQYLNREKSPLHLFKVDREIQDTKPNREKGASDMEMTPEIS
jgi:hypothetical protein